MSDDELFEPYRLPDDDGHPARYAARMMDLPEHAHLKEHEVSFGWLMRIEPKEKGGKVTLGSVHATANMAQGQFRDLFLMMLQRLVGALPEFVVVLDAGWWAEAGEQERCALIFHELSHVKQALDRFGAPRFDRDGNPVWTLVEHDITAFKAEVARFGAWHADISDFLHAARGA